MSQLPQNQTIYSLGTESQLNHKRGIFKMENQPKNRPCSGLTSKGTNDDIASIGTCGDFTRVRKLGYLPSYLKKETKSGVESELVNKYKKFKLAKRELVEHQKTLMKDFKQLQLLKEKFKKFGGRDFKIDTLDVIEFTGTGSENGCGDGDHQLRVGEKEFNFEQEIQRIRGRTKDCLFHLIELNSAAFKHVQATGSEELQIKINEIFSKIEEYVKTVNSEQDVSMQQILENLQLLRIPSIQPVTTKSDIHEEEIAGLKKVIQNLEVQSKMLQSDVDVKNREIEYLKNKDKSNVDTTIDECKNELQSEILVQKETITDYRNKLDERKKLHLILQEKIKQLEDKVAQQSQQMDENLKTFTSSLCEEQKKCEELKKMLEEAKNPNSMIVQKKGSSYELMSYQLAAANEDVKELQLKISNREKQINNLKQIINSDPNKTKDYNDLLLKYEELRRHDSCKSKEIQQMKEKLAIRTGTINEQIATISDLTTRLMVQGGSDTVELEKGNCTDPLQDEQMSKLSDQDRIIKKLENNKIRSNALRDQLLERISSLEKENDDMKGQIRKFHEDFTISRFMHDEQRRKKRLTDILVKQYQK